MDRRHLLKRARSSFFAVEAYFLWGRRLKLTGRDARSWKTILVEPFKQMRIGAYVIGLTLIFTLSLVAIVANTFWSQYQQVMELFAIADPRTQWELVLNDIFLRNVGLVILLATAFVTAMTYFIFKITHRYYGPLVSIERFVDQVSVGDYTARVIIRKGDELQSLVKRLNQMAESIEKRHEDAKEGDQQAS